MIKNEATATLFTNGAAFEVGGQENELRRNMATDGEGYGFKIYSTNNRLIGNIAEDNGGSGITIYGTDTTIVRNRAFGNGDGAQFFDLNDENFECDNNTWKKNKFDTRNAGCIK